MSAGAITAVYATQRPAVIVAKREHVADRHR
jgi:hypothetical protein